MPIYETSASRRLYIETSGPDATGARPVVFLHGWACHGGYFAPQFRGLENRFRVIAPDLRGHRHSHRRGDMPDLAMLAGDVRALIEPSSVLVGWSMGALVAFELIGRLGVAVAGLVVVDMAPRVVNDADWHRGLLGGYGAAQAERALDLMQRNWPLYVERFMPTVFAGGRTPDPALVDWVTREMGACDPQPMAALWRAIIEVDDRPLLPSIAAPTLILRGAESQLYGPGTTAWLKHAIPEAEVATVPRAGHAPHLEQPTIFNRLLTQFIDQLKR